MREKIVLALLLASTCLFAGVPNEITYQGRLREYGQPVTGTRTMNFKIYQAASGPGLSWESGEVSVAVSSGVFSYVLNPSIDWRQSDFWIETVVSGKTLSPREKITAQAFALHSKTAEDIEKTSGANIHFSIGTSTCMSVLSSGNVGIGKSDPEYKLDVSGGARFTQPVFVADPTNPGHAASKNYVDSTAGGGIPAGSSGQTLRHNGTGWSANSVIYNNGSSVGIGTTDPDAKLRVEGEVKSLVNGTTFYMVPRGAIIMWSGAIASIPSGWALCDGNNGTPDLRDKFVMGVSNSSENPGGSGGANSYSLTVNQLPTHNHTASSSNNTHSHTGFVTGADGVHAHNYTVRGWIDSLAPGASDKVWRGDATNNGTTSDASNHTHSIDISDSGTHSHNISVDSTGSGAAIDNRPAYYKIAFIMKILQ